MSEFYCAAPWRGLHINPRGDVKTCCAGDPNMLGNLNDHTIEEILHGPVMQEIRASIKQGQPHAYCYNCVQAERYGRSERDWHNNVNSEFDVTSASLTEHIPTLIDVRWNITCNLSCNYCGDKCSSKWAALKHVPFKSGARPYYEQVCDYLEQHREHIKEVALVGGEPLLLPENERLLDVIPEDCIVTLITNLSVDLESNAIFKKLQQRKKVGWSISLDNIAQRLEYVRYGTQWNQIEHNVQLIKELFAQGQWGGLHSVYNIYNCTRMQEFTDWARRIGMNIFWQSLYQPECLDPLKHSQEVYALATNEIDHMLKRTDLTDSERAFILQAQQNYKNSTPGLQKVDLVQYTMDVERNYHKDQQGKFVELWPELAFIFNE